MTDQEFREWGIHHITAMRLPDGWQATLLTFRDSLGTIGVSIDEAKAASNAIRLRDDCNTLDPSWQLRALLRHIERSRAEVAKKLINPHGRDGDPRGECETCRGTGLVIVPHLRCVPTGEWISPFHSFVVACSCALGNWKAERMQDHREKRALTLREYAERNPHWRQQLAIRERHTQAVNQAYFRLRGQELIGRLADRVGTQVGRGRDVA